MARRSNTGSWPVGAGVVVGLVVCAGLAVGARGVAAQSSVDLAGGDGALYVPTYPRQILVVDEATATIADRIQVPAGAPRSMVVSEDRQRFYMLDPTFEHFSTVDVAGRTVSDSFTLSEGNRTVRIRSFRVAPDGRHAILHLDPAVKHLDRFEIEPMALVLVELETRTIVKTLDWPTGAPTASSRMLFSPDGESLYHFTRRDVLVLDTDDYTVVDRWSLTPADEPSLGRLDFGFATDLVYEEPGFFTGLFRYHDPAQDRELMGIARIDLGRRDVDFYTVGPPLRMELALAPGRRVAYGLVEEIEHYEFWTFDLERRTVGRRRRVAGRPRMDVDVSSNGRLIYISQAGNTIDYYDATSFDLLHTLVLDGDMTSALILLPSER